jgi:uncharacterized protein YebE (UPF0316 family)
MSEINWVLTLLVFFSRILDVSLGTLRIIFIGKGKRLLAPLLGFIEVFIWIVIVSQLVQNVSNIVGYLTYAAGFAVGNYVGLVIENRLALGTLTVRATVSQNSDALIQDLKDSGYGVTSYHAEGSTGPVRVIHTVIKRRELGDVIDLIKENHPDGFYTVEEIRQVNEGVFHRPQPHSPFRFIGLSGKN